MRPDDSADNAERCVCPGCPTFNECMATSAERLYCARGKSSRDVSAVECMCGGCPVWAANGLASYYFCMHGAAD